MVNNKVHACRTDVGGKTSKGQYAAYSTNKRTTSSLQEVESRNLSLLRRYYEGKGLQQDTIYVLMMSWRSAT